MNKYKNCPFKTSILESFFCVIKIIDYFKFNNYLCIRKCMSVSIINEHSYYYN